MEVDEQNIEDLFENDESGDEHGTEQPLTEGPGANLVLGEVSREGQDPNDEGSTSKKDIKPKRKIAKQPLLNVDRIMGKKGIKVLPKLFDDFEPRPGKEFEDLDIVMDRMKHWAHRLYPKHPFDDVTKGIAKLGSKMQVQTNLKRIRLDLGVDPYFDKDLVDSDDENTQPKNDDMPNEEDTTERYGDMHEEDIFAQLIREADERTERRAHDVDAGGDTISASAEHQDISQSFTPNSLTDEQKERMLRNKQLAAEKRKQKEAQKMVAFQLEEVLKKMFI